MTLYAMYFAVYDISENSIRESIIQVLKDAGLVRIQKSVFCGKLAGQQKKDLMCMVRQIIDIDVDSFFLVKNCKVCFKDMLTVGQKFDEEYVSGKTKSMVF